MEDVKEVSSTGSVNISDLKEVETTIKLNASKFMGFINKSTINILEASRIVYEMSQKLSKNNYMAFRLEIGAPSESTTTKYEMIGKRYEVLKEYANILPSSWTFLYNLVKDYKDEKIREFCTNGTIKPTISQKEFKENVGDVKDESDADKSSTKESESKTSQSESNEIVNQQYAIEFTFNNLAPADKARFKKALSELENSFREKVIFKQTPTLEAFFSDSDLKEVA